MKLKNYFLLILLAALWGPSFLFIKIAVVDISPIMMAAMRIGFAAIFLNVFLLMRKIKLPKDKTFWKHVALAGFFAQALPFILINWGEQYIDSGLASIINGLTPLSTVVLAHFTISAERLSAKKLVGVALGFTGLVVLSLPKLTNGFDAAFLGIVAVTLGAVSYAIGLVYSRKYLSKAKPMHAPAGQLLACSIYLVPLAFIFDSQTVFSQIGTPAWVSIFLLSFFGTAVAFVVYFNLIERAPASFVSLVTYIMPIFGIALGTIFLDEVITSTMVLGMLLILSGILIVNIRLKFLKPKIAEDQVVAR
ncbi:EamA family transporter [Fulvivirga sp.]|uniref:DMT family transporter n=1 Tax=Fulvivirga sp. TaxID=1931237 RepID=UPI0032EBAB51